MHNGLSRDKRQMNEQITINDKMELKALGMLCATAGAIMIVETSKKDAGREKEKREMLEKQIDEFVDILWNRTRR